MTMDDPADRNNWFAPPLTEPRHRYQPIIACASAAALAVTMMSGSTLAQTLPSATGGSGVQTSDAQLEEIVVTAQHRSQRLQDVPVAVTSLSATALEQQGVSGTSDLAQAVPSLIFTSQLSAANPYIRGVGSQLFDPVSESPVAVYVDDVYIANPQGNVFSLAGTRQIDVLNGPQGTLFGRNATGGVIQVVTKDPSQNSAVDMSLGYGNYDTVDATFYGTTGLGQNLAADVAVIYHDQNDGYGRNVTLDKDIFKNSNFGIRSKLLWTPTDRTRVTLIGDYSRAFHNNSYQYGPGVISPSYGVELYAGPFNSTQNLEQKVKTRTWGGALRIEQDLGGLSLTSITSRRKSIPYFVLDSDQGPQTLGGSIYHSYVRNWSQELQLTNQSKGKFEWVLGLFYFDVVGGYNPWQSIGGRFFWNAEQKTRAWAGYGQATYHLGTGTSITGGLRWTTEDQSMSSINLTTPANVAHNSMNHKKLTWRIAVNQQFTDDIMAYVSYNRGYKSGGYNLLDTTSLNKVPALQLVPSYNPEVVDAYEVGLKSYLFDRRVRFNLAAFYYDYKDIQLQKTVAVGNLILNAANAKVKGVEAEIEAAVTSHLTLRAGASVLDAKYRDFLSAPAVTQNGVGSTIDASGNRLVASPKFTGNIGVEYRTEVAGAEVTAAVNAVHNDGFFWHPDNRLRQPAYTLLNTTLTIGLDDNRYQVRLWAKNLTDERYYISEAEVQGRGDWTMLAPPRTYGMTFLAHFK